jgi:hypothetical protein
MRAARSMTTASVSLDERFAGRGCGRGVFNASQAAKRRGGRLLHDVGQLVGEKTAALCRARRVAVRAEHDVAPDRVRLRVYRLGGLRGVGVRMYSHPAEVASEARLHKVACRRIEGLAGRTKDFVDERRRFSLHRVACPDALSMQALVHVLGLLFRLTSGTRSTARARAL